MCVVKISNQTIFFLFKTLTRSERVLRVWNKCLPYILSGVTQNVCHSLLEYVIVRIFNLYHQEMLFQHIDINKILPHPFLLIFPN